jgi:hypothetical protein
LVTTLRRQVGGGEYPRNRCLEEVQSPGIVPFIPNELERHETLHPSIRVQLADNQKTR